MLGEICRLPSGVAPAAQRVMPGVKQRYDKALAGRKALRTAPDKRTRQQNETLQEIENRTLCSMCGESGHWHTDDPEASAEAA